MAIAKSLVSGNKLGEIPWYAAHPWVLRRRPDPLQLCSAVHKKAACAPSMWRANVVLL